MGVLFHSLAITRLGSGSADTDRKGESFFVRHVPTQFAGHDQSSPLFAVKRKVTKPTMKILFICTHNRCRSILAEAIANHLSGGCIEAYSAGSQPAGQVHPLSLRYLQERNIPVAGLQSQSWDDFDDLNPDVVITVCDSAARESCPVWFGDTVKVHWGLPDPSRHEGNEEDVANAFYGVMDTIESRFRYLLSLDLAAMTTVELKQALNEIAQENH